ncbi:GvpL/GvpF family gas vesicle protein [Streptomyces sp. NPDC020917]|uniref:GvpL/GvpF family gas vesicle protein n=1 Tax=Streptomyces sp. NPDC020917 TaxID=3365102 RepID=UPI0037A06F12
MATADETPPQEPDQAQPPRKPDADQPPQEPGAEQQSASAGAKGARCYVYGVVAEAKADPKVGELPAVGGDSGARVGYVRHGGLAAAVSPLPDGGALGAPEDLRAHTQVLNTLAATGAPVLPFRFGTVFHDRKQVAEDLLARDHDAFVTALQRLSGRAQFTVRAVYDVDALLRRILAERPDIAEVRASLGGLREQAARYQRMRLGELMAEAVDARRAGDTAFMTQRLGPLADALAVSPDPTDDAVADVAFLISDDRRAAFERAVEGLAREWHGRALLRLLGPLAAYDFAAEAMEGAGGAG